MAFFETGVATVNHRRGVEIGRGAEGRRRWKEKRQEGGVNREEQGGRTKKRVKDEWER